MAEQSADHRRVQPSRGRACARDVAARWSARTGAVGFVMYASPSHSQPVSRAPAQSWCLRLRLRGPGLGGRRMAGESVAWWSAPTRRHPSEPVGFRESAERHSRRLVSADLTPDSTRLTGTDSTGMKPAMSLKKVARYSPAGNGGEVSSPFAVLHARRGQGALRVSGLAASLVVREEREGPPRFSDGNTIGRGTQLLGNAASCGSRWFVRMHRPTRLASDRSARGQANGRAGVVRRPRCPARSIRRRVS